MFSSGKQTRSRLKWLVITFLILIGVLTLPFRSFANVDDFEPTARIFAILSGNTEVQEAKNPLVIITRGSGGCPPTDGIAKKGVPLCRGDTVKIAKGVKLTIVFGSLTSGDEVELGLSKDDPREYLKVEISSIFCGSFCRWFASLSNPFRNRVQHVALTNKSTVYEVVSSDDKSFALMVYEGEVEVTKDLSDGAGSPSPAPEASPGPTSTDNAAEIVPRLYKVIFNENGTIVDRQEMDQGALCDALAYSSDLEVLRHQTPAEAGGNLAKFTNFENSAIRTGRFRAARCASFWDPNQAQHFETLGYVYNDWNDGQKALEMLAKATKVYAAASGWTGPTDKMRVNTAIALRQLGKDEDLKKALDELEKVFAGNDPASIASALNVRGSIFYDQARNELLYNRTNEGLARAKDMLLKASADFDKALPLAGKERQYIEVNRAQVLKAEADIAQREEKYSLAETKYIESIKKLMEAYAGEVDNTKIKIASLLVARARAALANTYAVMGKPAQSEEFYKKAEETYIGAIRDAEDQQEIFAAPYCSLGSLYLVLGRTEAANNYDQCVVFSKSSLVKDVRVPYVTGMSRAAAIQILTEAGLVPEIISEGETAQTQEPEVQDVVKAGTKVKIKLSTPGRQ